jgi:acyl-coenzyme A synthetase/AMP-(fatty) acid ligase
MSSLPLTTRRPDEVLALRHGQAMTVGRFLYQARALADELNGRGQIINLCSDRYAFSVAFAGALIAGATNLLPGNRLPGTIDGLLERYPQSRIVSDGLPPDLPHPYLDLGRYQQLEGDLLQGPGIDGEQLAAVVFTSGSTGQASRIDKPWRTLYESSRVNAAEFGRGRDIRHALATVPPQHMWGLETSVLLPWFASLIMASGQPFYVADIVQALELLPSPRMLVSTPVHLRAMVDSQTALPTIERVFSSTAPLGPKLARALERQCGGQVIEIYGCSETGCLARRRAAEDAPWTLFDAFDLSRQADRHVVHAAHLPEPVALMDRLDIATDGRFRLLGRDSDLVNIGGKRASLADLTQQLLDIPGVIDGAIFQPPDQSDGPVTRLAALVVAPDLDTRQLRLALAQRIDPAFMPRPLKRVETLPRAASGKLPKRELFELYQRSATAAT